MTDAKKTNIFLRGLAVALPTLIIIFILTLAIKFLYSYLAAPLGKGVLLLLEIIPGLKDLGLRESPLVIGIIGFPLAFVIIFFVGTFLGRALVKIIEDLVLYRFPVVRSIYPYAKQFSELFFSDQSQVKFQKVVAVQYPRQGLYQIAFITSAGLKDLTDTSGKKTITVFIPSSPTPFTGWTVFVPADEIIPLTLTIDEAIRLLVSGGVLVPPGPLEHPTSLGAAPNPPSSTNPPSF